MQEMNNVRCLKTGFRFLMDGLEYASDMYLSDGRITIVANKEGYPRQGGGVLSEVVGNLDNLAPQVGFVTMRVNEEFRTFWRKWNFDAPETLLDDDMLLILR